MTPPLSFVYLAFVVALSRVAVNNFRFSDDGTTPAGKVRSPDMLVMPTCVPNTNTYVLLRNEQTFKYILSDATNFDEGSIRVMKTTGTIIT